MESQSNSGVAFVKMQAFNGTSSINGSSPPSVLESGESNDFSISLYSLISYIDINNNNGYDTSDILLEEYVITNFSPLAYEVKQINDSVTGQEADVFEFTQETYDGSFSISCMTSSQPVNLSLSNSFNQNLHTILGNETDARIISIIVVDVDVRNERIERNREII